MKAHNKISKVSLFKLDLCPQKSCRYDCNSNIITRMNFRGIYVGMEIVLLLNFRLLSFLTLIWFEKVEKTIFWIRPRIRICSRFRCQIQNQIPQFFEWLVSKHSNWVSLIQTIRGLQHLANCVFIISFQWIKDKWE